MYHPQRQNSGKQLPAKKKKRAKKKVSAAKSAAKGKKSDAQAGRSSSSPKKSRAGSKSKAIVMDSSTDDEKHGEEEKVTARDKSLEKEEESSEKELKTYLHDEVCTWIFNPPNSSHIGGVWERLIGITRRILDALLLKEGGSHLSHEVLTTLMAEVMAIINARPLIPVSTDPEMPAILTPATLLTLKRDVISAPPGDFNVKDIHSQQWRQVQSLSDRSGKRWKQEYLSTIQTRRKWNAERPNLQIGDLVLLKDGQVRRNECPTGLIVKSINSHDNKVRKVDVKIIRQGTPIIYTRPVSEVVLLLRKETV
ncbi:uncharacterized protein LOC133546578 [Nerophis ophidion]|uniref:uncharacterized protein LOC133546578 n=1 Tax=Nerophis ophidion TaxID=159077 RepID=UPI002ADFA917|nr:uncharacterized protein LOC133546578 [Nerophis ophidion]